MANSQTPLTPREERTLERVGAVVGERDTTGREAVVAALADPDLTEPEVQSLLDRLLSKGYLYVVDDELYVT